MHTVLSIVLKHTQKRDVKPTDVGGKPSVRGVAGAPEPSSKRGCREDTVTKPMQGPEESQPAVSGWQPGPS